MRSNVGRAHVGRRNQIKVKKFSFAPKKKLKRVGSYFHFNLHKNSFQALINVIMMIDINHKKFSSTYFLFVET